jgi:hypothetical protein
VDALTYDCGCRARDGIVIERCAWAAETKAQLDRWGQTDMPGIARDGIVRLAIALSAHYPSTFAAPTPCGPREAL